MVQQMIDSKFSEFGLGNTETGLSNCDKQLPVAVKKTALRDLQNENRIMAPAYMGNSPFPKERGPIIDAIKNSGTKRPSPECPVSPPRPQSSSSNAANGHLVYVRRKSEVELAFAPNQVASSTSSSGKPPGPISLGKSSNRLPPAESNYSPATPAIPSLDNSKGTRRKNWEERYLQLQMLLRKLDQSDPEDYLQMLRSLSSVELSRHAVELEKRSIQLSLEEAKELQRVGFLNVLGKSMKNYKEPSVQQDPPEK